MYHKGSLYNVHAVIDFKSLDIPHTAFHIFLSAADEIRIEKFLVSA
jgi:hypothetical protein